MENLGLPPSDSFQELRDVLPEEQDSEDISSSRSSSGRKVSKTVRIMDSMKKQQAIKPNKSTKIKSQSIHGMTDEDKATRPHREIMPLSRNERLYLVAVERGDVATVRSGTNPPILAMMVGCVHDADDDAGGVRVCQLN
eukprot:maker-scaffold1971_size23625-snap-gene-0.3 protein:Tk00850 transcript:maker-scaffold1971_size23625-snap-gene-0.3-mRNA-1 annotation:"transient receptor potential-gamma protein"